MALRFGSDDVPQERLRALDVDGKVIVNEEYRHLSFFFARARLQQQQFVDHALISAEPNRVAEKSRHRAELATIRASSSRFHRDDPKGSPAFSNLLQHPAHTLRNQIELFEINRLPRNHRIILQRRLALLPKCVHRLVNILELSASGIRNNLWPSRISFTERDGVGMPPTA